MQKNEIEPLSYAIPQMYSNINSKHNQSNFTKNMGHILMKLCSHSVTLKDSDWLGTDWLRHSGIYCMSLNGTQCLCGTNIWPWLPSGWLGCCTLGFPWAQGRVCSTVRKISNLPLLRPDGHALFSTGAVIWTQSLFPPLA